MAKKNKSQNGFELSAERRNELIEVHRTMKDKKYADRIKAIILLDDGYSKTEIERILLIDRKSIRKYLNDYKENGLIGLLDDDS